MKDFKLLSAEVFLAEKFTVLNEREWHSVNQIIDDIKRKGSTKGEIKGARLNLDVESRTFPDGQRWKWGNVKSPQEVWEIKSAELEKERSQ